MRTTHLFFCVLVLSCNQRNVDDVLPAYTKAYNSAFAKLGTVGLADTGMRIERLAEAGWTFQPQLAELKRRQNEVNDLVVKSVQIKKQAMTDKKPAAIEQATALLIDAEGKAEKLHADMVSLSEKLTAAGAPAIQPEPARDPNARD